MNFSTIEDSVLEEKKKFSNFLSRFLKNSRVLIILLAAAVITAISVSIWIKSPEYQVLYNHLSEEDGEAIIDQLNQMKIPYQFTENLGQLLIPKNKIHELRLRLSENNLPRGGGVGFELLDKEKFGVSQFHEKINYQRALEGELSRTIQRIDIIKNARIHIALPKSSLFLQDKKKPSASVVLELQPRRTLNSGQINAILHLISSSVSELSVDNITIVDQAGNLLNHVSLGYNQVNDAQFKYSEEIESRYSNRIKNILEPLVGNGNVHAQVTAQIDFNTQEKTQEYYLPNTNHRNQSIRSRQDSIHDETEQEQNKEKIPTALSKKVDSLKNIKKNNYENKISKNDSDYLNSNINHDYRINYELNHTVSHIKMNTGEIKRLSAAVVINFVKDKNGKLVPFTLQQINNFKKLVSETIGYSKLRGDSIHIVNASFFKHDKQLPIKLNNSNKLQLSQVLFTFVPWIFSILFVLFLLKRYICSFSKNNIQKNNSINKDKNHIEQTIAELNIQKNSNTDTLIHKISNISNQNPRTIALIIRQWMSDKK